jgi:hypothetical protein
MKVYKVYIEPIDWVLIKADNEQHAKDGAMNYIATDMEIGIKKVEVTKEKEYDYVY